MQNRCLCYLYTSEIGSYFSALQFMCQNPDAEYATAATALSGHSADARWLLLAEIFWLPNNCMVISSLRRWFCTVIWVRIKHTYRRHGPASWIVWFILRWRRNARKPSTWGKISFLFVKQLIISESMPDDLEICDENKAKFRQPLSVLLV